MTIKISGKIVRIRADMKSASMVSSNEKVVHCLEYVVWLLEFVYTTRAVTSYLRKAFSTLARNMMEMIMTSMVQMDFLVRTDKLSRCG